MPVKINPPGTPLPDDHPLKGGCIILGWNRPPSSAKPSAPEDEHPPAKPDLSPFELEARQSLEDSLHRLYEQHTGQPWKEPNPSSESTTPDSPEAVPAEK